MLYVEKTTPEDCFELAKNLKQVDKYELAIWGLDPLQALLQPFRYTKRKVHTYTTVSYTHLTLPTTPYV